MKKSVIALAFAAFLSPLGMAADYVLDTKGAHASINFKVQHLGYSWLTGRFNTFDGGFSYDEANPAAAKISVTIDTTSVDSNHAERDKHLRGNDFLAVKKYPEAKFVSTKIVPMSDNRIKVEGDFTLRGVTKSLTIDAYKLGEGKDPWGGYRAGFSGTTSFKMADYGIPMNLGPASANVELSLHIEGIRK